MLKPNCPASNPDRVPGGCDRFASASFIGLDTVANGEWQPTGRNNVICCTKAKRTSLKFTYFLYFVSIQVNTLCGSSHPKYANDCLIRQGHACVCQLAFLLLWNLNDPHTLCCFTCTLIIIKLFFSASAFAVSER